MSNQLTSKRRRTNEHVWRGRGGRKGRGKKKKEERREQATESTRRMPRRSRPMKDAETGETFRGSCIQAKSPEYPNGATPPE